jgi:hypothetical protein
LLNAGVSAGERIEKQVLLTAGWSAVGGWKSRICCPQAVVQWEGFNMQVLLTASFSAVGGIE